MTHFLFWGGIAVTASLVLLKTVDFFWPPVLRQTPSPVYGYWRMPAVMLNQGDVGNEIRLPNIGFTGTLTKLEAVQDGRVQLTIEHRTATNVVYMSIHDPVDVWDADLLEEV